MVATLPAEMPGASVSSFDVEALEPDRRPTGWRRAADAPWAATGRILRAV